MNPIIWIIYSRRYGHGPLAQATTPEAKDAALRLLFGSSKTVPDEVAIDELTPEYWKQLAQLKAMR